MDSVSTEILAKLNSNQKSFFEDSNLKKRYLLRIYVSLAYKETLWHYVMFCLIMYKNEIFDICAA